MIMSLAETRIVMLQTSPRTAKQAELKRTTQVAEKAKREKSESDNQLKVSLAALEAIQRQLDFLTEQDKSKDERLEEDEKQNDVMIFFLSESKAQFLASSC